MKQNLKGHWILLEENYGKSEWKFWGCFRKIRIKFEKNLKKIQKIGGTIDEI